MAARFVSNSEIAAGASPLGAMRRNPTRAGAKLGEQMRKLMAQGAIDFGRIVFAQTRVERDQIAARVGAAGGAEQARVPFHVDFGAELFGVERGENLARLRFQC